MSICTVLLLFPFCSLLASALPSTEAKKPATSSCCEVVRGPVGFVSGKRRHPSVFFIFIFFKKKLQKYIFGFRFYSSIPIPPGRGAAGGLPPLLGGRDLFANKNKNYLRINPWWGSAAPCWAAGPLPPSGGAAGTCI